MSTDEGSLVACLVREFLEFFQLDFTLSVFDPETAQGKYYNYGGRSKLIKDLQIENLNGMYISFYIIKKYELLFMNWHVSKLFSIVPSEQIYLFTGKKGPLLGHILHIALSQNADSSGVTKVT